MTPLAEGEHNTRGSILTVFGPLFVANPSRQPLFETSVHLSGRGVTRGNSSEKFSALFCRRPPTIYHTHRRLPILKWDLRGASCRNLREQQNTHYPRTAIAMFNVISVGVVHGLWGSILTILNKKVFSKALSP